MGATCYRCGGTIATEDVSYAVPAVVDGVIRLRHDGDLICERERVRRATSGEVDPVGQLLTPTQDEDLQRTRTGGLRALFPGPFTFLGECNQDGSYTDTLTWEALVYQAVGAASACWDHLEGAGVFREDRARQVAEAVLDRAGIPRDAPMRA